LVFAARDPYRHAVAVVIAAIANIVHSALHIYSHLADLLSMQHISTEICGIYIPTLVLSVLAVMLLSHRESRPEAKLRAA
jgi:hypothetical protein